MDENCKLCRFWYSGVKTDGFCRRYAPRPSRSQDDADGEFDPNYADWPRVDESDWCGEFERGE